MAFSKVVSTEYLKNLFKSLLFFASVAFLIFFIPIQQFALLPPQYTVQQLGYVLGAFVGVTSVTLAYMVT